MRAPSVLVVSAVLLLLGACSTRPPAAAPQALPVSGAWSREHAPSPAASWWQAWNDGQLDALIAKALADNPDSALVAARVTQARAAQAAARAAGSPSVTLNAGAERQRVARRLRLPAEDGSPPRAVRRRFELDALAAYELDWLGRKTITMAGAHAQSVAAEHDAAAARIALICAVVEAYADLALHCAERGDTADVPGYLDKAVQIANAVGLEDWRRDQILVKIATGRAERGAEQIGSRLMQQTPISMTRRMPVAPVLATPMTQENRR